jgi:predicted dehydrogenase
MSAMRRSISRRRFLKFAATATAAAAAAPYVLARSAWGQKAAVPEVAPSDRIGLGVIGCGRSGQQWLSTLSYAPYVSKVQIVSICDADARTFKAALPLTDRAFKGCSTAKDFREILANSKIDAVMICTPDHWHAVMAAEAMRAGKDVYCESPLSLTVREARAMANLARRYGRVLQHGTINRSFPAYIQGYSLLHAKRLGEIKTVHVQAGGPSKPCYLPGEPAPEGLDWDMWLGPAPTAPYNIQRCTGAASSSYGGWRAWREYSGGPMTSYGVIFLDTAQWVLGLDDTGPVEIAPPSGKDHPYLTWKYANGVTIINSQGAKGAPIEVTGSAGVIGVGLGRVGCQTWPAELAASPPADSGLRYRPGDHFLDFVECIKGRGRPMSDVAAACRSTTACHLANIAVWLNRPLNWDPVKEEIVGDAEASRWLDRPRRSPWRV